MNNWACCLIVDKYINEKLQKSIPIQCLKMLGLMKKYFYMMLFINSISLVSDSLK